MEDEHGNKSLRKRDRVARFLRRLCDFRRSQKQSKDALRTEQQENTNAKPATAAASPTNTIPDSTGASRDERDPIQCGKQSLGGTENPTADSSHCEEALPESGRLLWQAAVEKLEPNDREIIQHKFTGSTVNTHIQDVLQGLVSLAEEKKRAFETSEKEVPDPAGKSRAKVAIWTLMPKILVCVRRFKEIGDIAVSFDPVHAALPWAAIRFLLEAITVAHEQAGLLLAGLERVSYLALRSGVYQTMYLDRSSPLDTQSKDLLSAALVNLYREILSFLALFIRRFSANKVHQVTSALFNPNRVSEAFLSLDNCASRVAGEATRCHEIFTKNAHEVLGSKVDSLRTLMDENVIDLNSRIEEMHLLMKDEEQSEILRWLSKIPYQSDHDSARSGHIEGTGRWLLEHQEFLQWQSCDSNSIFWLHGIPGAGKTKLSANVVENILQTLESGDNHSVAYFYCDRNSPEHKDPCSVSQSIVRQLASGTVSRQGLNRYVYDLYREQKALSFPSEALSIETCAQILPKLLTSYSRTTIVVDGLDECDINNRYKLIRLFDGLIEQADCNCNVKIFISSRDDRDLMKEYIDRTHLEVEACHNDSDIRKYVEERLNEAEKSVFYEPLSPDLRRDILDTFDTKSEGMFQWAVLQMNELLKFSRQRDVKDQLSSYLSKLPKGLESSYEQIMKSIIHLPGSEPDVARRAFWCIIDAGRRLSPEELVAAVFQPPESENIFIKPDIAIDFVLESCRNLIVQDGSNCRLSHLSVAEFLESYSPMKPHIQEVHLLGKLCLRLLLEEPEAQERHALQAYTEYWHVHFTQHNFKTPDVDSTKLLLEFLGPPETGSDPLERWYRRRGWHHTARVPSAITALEWGLVTTLEYWFDHSELDPNFAHRNQSLLYLVAKKGERREDMLEHLLRHGANVNAEMGPNGPTALLSAVRKKDMDLVRRLVNRLEAQVNHGQDTNRGSPLCLAISLNPRRRSLDMNSGGSRLKYAKEFELLKVLLEAGADPNITDGYDAFLPALHLNIRRCEEGQHPWSTQLFGKVYDPTVTELLLEYKADINLQTAKFKTALAVAVTSRNAVAIEHLLRLGADYNLERPLYIHLDNVLLLNITDAKLRPYVDVVQQLVNAGALDYLLHPPPGPKTKHDFEYEGRVAMLAACMTKNDNSGAIYDYKRFFQAVQAAKKQGMPYTAATPVDEHESNE